MSSPKPSRRCAGARSRAVRPRLRAVAPRRWAMASQTEASAWPTAPKVRAIGPGPLRTARGAGRRAAVFLAAGRLGLRLLLLPVLRDRVLEPDRDLPFDAVLFDAAVLDVLELRDPGG